MGNHHVARPSTPVHGHHEEGIALVCPRAVVEDESKISFPLELKEEAVVLQGGIVKPPPKTPLALELVEQAHDAKDLHREEQPDSYPSRTHSRALPRQVQLNDARRSHPHADGEHGGYDMLDLINPFSLVPSSAVAAWGAGSVASAPGRTTPEEWVAPSVGLPLEATSSLVFIPSLPLRCP